MKKILFLMACLTFVSACGDEKQTISSSVDKGTSETEKVETENTKKEEKKEVNTFGSRSNPVPVGQNHTVQHQIFDANFDGHDAVVELLITEVERGESVYEKAIAQNEFNEAPVEGYEYVAFKVTATVKEAATQDDAFYISDYDFNFIGADGSPYESVSVVFEPTLGAEIYAGGSTLGYVIGQVKKDDSILVVYEDGNGKNVFFSVEKGTN